MSCLIVHCAVSFQHTLVKEKSERSLDRLELAEKKLEQFAQQQRMSVNFPHLLLAILNEDTIGQ